MISGELVLKTDSPKKTISLSNELEVVVRGFALRSEQYPCTVGYLVFKQLRVFFLLSNKFIELSSIKKHACS